MKFFKPEDFNLGADVGFVEVTTAALMANAKLEREGVPLSGNTFGFKSDVLLLHLEPIVKCEHPSERVKVSLGTEGANFKQNFYCECGARVKPKSFEVCSD